MSVIGFGAWEAGGDAWGANPSDGDVIGAMRAAFDAGMSWIDTAEVYGNGVSESFVGRAVGGRRDGVLIATKVAPADEGSGFRPKEIRRACDASLARLGIETIDLYQLHWPDPLGTPVEESWGTMGELVNEGKVRFVGVSNFDRELIERCEAIRHVDSLQQELSLLRLEDRELIRWCGGHGTGVVSYSPLAAGMLTGAFDRERALTVDDWRRHEVGGPFSTARVDASLAIVDALRPIASRLGVGVAQLSLAWNVAQPGVTSAIAGSRDEDHTRANAAAGDLELDAATLEDIEMLLSA
jgi:aryl-alcohol dehydrogenase-like predicted oxidoreductase